MNIRRGQVHYIDGGVRSGPVVVITSDDFNARVSERPWVLAIVPMPHESAPEIRDSLIVATGPGDPVQGFVIVHDVRRPPRKWYRPEADAPALTPDTMRRIDMALATLISP